MIWVIPFVLMLLALCLAGPVTVAAAGGGVGLSGTTDSLRLCDSAHTRQIVNRLFAGTRYSRPIGPVRMTLPNDSTFTLYPDNDGNWHEPLFRSKRGWWAAKHDSITLALHHTVNLDQYLAKAGGDPYVYREFLEPLVSIMRDRVAEDEQCETYRLSPVVFPEASYHYSDWRNASIDANLLYLGYSPDPVLCARLELFAEDDCETGVVWINEGLWFRDGERYVPGMTFEIERSAGAVDGFRRHDLRSVYLIDDVDDDGANEIIYRRTYVMADETTQTSFCDPGEIILEYTEGDPPPEPACYFGNITGRTPTSARYSTIVPRRRPALRPTRMITDQGSVIPIRPHLPLLLFPGANAVGKWTSIAGGGDWTTYVDPPVGGGHFICLGSKRTMVFKERERMDDAGPILAYRLVGDSIEFEISVNRDGDEDGSIKGCAGPGFVVALWIDADLPGDFDSHEGGDDDRVYLISIDSTGSAPMVKPHKFGRRNGDVVLLPTTGERPASRPEPAHPDAWPTNIRWRMGLEEVGLLETAGRPVMCGIAAEVTCAGMFAGDDWYYIAGQASFPSGFNRTDPTTWGSLMIAPREDGPYKRD